MLSLTKSRVIMYKTSLKDCQILGIILALYRLRLNQIVNINKEIKRKIVTFVMVKFKLKNWIGMMEDISNCSRGLKIYLLHIFRESNKF